MWEEETADSFRRKLLWWIGGLVIAAAIGFGIWYRWLSGPHTPEIAPVVRQAPPAPAPSTEAPVSNPIPSAGDTNTALPALNDSDQLLQDSIAAVIGHNAVDAFLVPQSIVRHIVVTVDNLPRKKLAVDLRPLKPTPGQTVTSTQGDLVVLSEANFERYTPLVRVAQATDTKALVASYERLYPLFQQAYEDLGYPGKYFNDRLVEVIDHLLETPEVPAPIQLAQPKVFYTFADPGLEARSAGQKLLIRMGPANARAIKAKLREFRDAIAKKK